MIRERAFQTVARNWAQEAVSLFQTRSSVLETVDSVWKSALVSTLFYFELRVSKLRWIGDWPAQPVEERPLLCKTVEEPWTLFHGLTDMANFTSRKNDSAYINIFEFLRVLFIIFLIFRKNSMKSSKISKHDIHSIITIMWITCDLISEINITIVINT